MTHIEESSSNIFPEVDNQERKTADKKNSPPNQTTNNELQNSHLQHIAGFLNYRLFINLSLVIYSQYNTDIIYNMILIKQLLNESWIDNNKITCYIHNLFPVDKDNEGITPDEKARN